MDQFRLETTFEFIVNLCPKCRTKFGCRGEPSVPGIFKFIAKVHETGFIFDEPRLENACELINIACRNWTFYAPVYVKYCDMISVGLLKVHLVQELKLHDHPFRFRYSRWTNEKQHDDHRFIINRWRLFPAGWVH